MTLVVALANEIKKETKSWSGSHGLRTKFGLGYLCSNLDFILSTSSGNPAFPSMLRVSHPSVTSGTVPVIYELYNHQQNA